MSKLLAVIALLILLGCTTEGEVTNSSTREIIINGKGYKWIKVVPADNEKGVWLLIPYDSEVEIPQVTSHIISCGRNCNRMYTGLWIKS